MSRRARFGLWLALSIPAAANAECLPSGFVCTALEQGRLCVVGTEEGGHDWYLFEAGPLPRKLLHAAEISLLQVAELAASPQQRYLAVISVGEGHPLLDILDLTALLQDRPAALIHSFNPYPNSVGIDRWHSDTRLDVSVPIFVEDPPPPLPPCPGEHYRLSLPDGALKCLAPEQ